MIQTARTGFPTRQAVLTVAIAALIMSAGCSSFLTDGNPPAEGAEPEPSTQTPAPTPTNSTSRGESIPANGTDIRSVSLPENYSNTVYGDIDSGDPVLDGTDRYYEPIVFAAESGDTVNVTMSSIANDPELQLRNPNGTTVAIDNDGGSGNDARFEMLTLNETGQYTLVASAAEPNTGFEYTLTVEEYEEPLYAGPMSSWNERERYGEFAADYVLTSQDVAGGPANWTEAESPAETVGNLTAVNTSINTEEDYAIVTYVIDAENLSEEQRTNVHLAVLSSYVSLYELYQNSDGPTNLTWAPDRIYHRVVDHDYNLYRTAYIDTEWAANYAENRDSPNAARFYQLAYHATVRSGPANEDYEEGSESSITVAEFPEYYQNTTIVEEVEEEGE